MSGTMKKLYGSRGLSVPNPTRSEHSSVARRDCPFAVEIEGRFLLANRTVGRSRNAGLITETSAPRSTRAVVSL